MTRTTQVEWHEDRPFVPRQQFFGSPPEVTYWREKLRPHEGKKKKKSAKVKEPKTYYPGRRNAGRQVD